jgi:hypothetical protein
MATRNGAGRNLSGSNPSYSKVAQARYAAIQKARKAGIYNKIVDYITQAGSVQQVMLIEKRYNLNAAETKKETTMYNGVEVETINFGSI